MVNFPQANEHVFFSNDFWLTILVIFQLNRPRADINSRLQCVISLLEYAWILWLNHTELHNHTQLSIEVFFGLQTMPPTFPIHLSPIVVVFFFLHFSYLTYKKKLYFSLDVSKFLILIFLCVCSVYVAMVY